MRLTASAACAALCALLCDTTSAAYLDNLNRKVDRGFSNALGCWLEVPYQTYASSSEKGVAAGAAQGFCTGILLLPCRLVSGVIDIVTFPAPCPRTGWDGWMRPEYNPWVEAPDLSPAAVPAVEEPAPLHAVAGADPAR